MKRTLILCLMLMAVSGSAQNLPDPVSLPNGWKLSPAGMEKPLGDLPLNIIISSKGKYMAVANCGQSVQSIQLFDPKTNQQLDSVVIPKTWYGLAFSRDEKKLFASGGHDNLIRVYAIENNKLRETDSIVLGKPWPQKIGPAGMVLDEARNRLYVVTMESNSLLLIDLASKIITDSLALGDEGYTCLLSPSGRLWR